MKTRRTSGPLDPEVLPPEGSRDVPPELEQLARLLDRAVQVGPFGIGLDGVLGLIPGVGDFASGVLSAYIVVRAARDGVPRPALVRMMGNIALDSLVGVIPFGGDLFDVLYQSNTKNIRIYREALQGRRDPRKDWAFLGLLLGVVFLILAIPVVLTILLLVRLLQ